MEGELTIKELRKKVYLTEEETTSVLKCYYPIHLLRGMIRKNKFNFDSLMVDDVMYFRSESVLKFYETLRYVKNWRALFSPYLKERRYVQRIHLHRRKCIPKVITLLTLNRKVIFKPIRNGMLFPKSIGAGHGTYDKREPKQADDANGKSK